MHPRYLDKGIGSTSKRGLRRAFIEFQQLQKIRKIRENPKTGRAAGALTWM